MFGRLRGTLITRSPLSHIAEAISTTSYLVQEPILQPDHSVSEVFVYSGNAWRGQLRDLCATYMLDYLQVQVPLDTFHLLFSGGRIGGEQQVDMARLRAIRQTIPMLALFGGGVGNQILPGKLRVSNAYPVCKEAIPVLSTVWHEQAQAVSYRQLTIEKSFTRKDDVKDDSLRAHLQVDHARLLQEAEASSPARAETVAQQMRMTSELLIAGVTLVSEIELMDLTEIEMGCLVSALHAFSRSPYIGGQGNRGHGHVRLHYDLLDLDTGEVIDFLAVDDTCHLSALAEAAKDAYDQHLRQIYNGLLDTNREQVLKLLEVG